ncbi:hypothetical protein GFY24_18585 [Nocardia sp. SYP-A9097]|nr:hypothetical protein [Nocardia sp. SYP-A9097]
MAAVSALLLTGCARQDTETTATLEATVVPVASGNAAPAPNGAAPTSDPPAVDVDAPLSPCGDIGTAATLPDCMLQSHDAAALAFEVRHTGSRAHVVTTVNVLSGGQARQSIVESDTDAAGAIPKLRDLDADGRDELIIPLALTTANARYAIYHVTGGALDYHRAGELSGVGMDTSGAGYVIVSARAGYASWDIEFWTFVTDTLHPLITAQVRPIDDGSGKVAGTTCTTIDSGGLDITGLTQDQATQQFCAEPAVQRVRRH